MLMDDRLTMRRLVRLSGAIFLLLSGYVQALDSNAGRLDSDTGRQLWWQTQQYIQRKENNVSAAMTESEASVLVLNGQRYRVANNSNDVGMALYLSLTHQQWQDAQRYLAAYQNLAEHDKQLVWFAEGELARVEGNLRTAEDRFRAILRQRPDFMLVRLELARVLFDGQRNSESLAMFEELLTAYADLPASLLSNIGLFVQALKQRESWHGSFAVSYGFNDNSNLSPNQPPQCLLAAPNGECITERRVPLAHRTFGTVFDVMLSRRWQFSGHHGLLVRGLLYGENYPGWQGHSDSENLASLAVGYSFRDQYNELLLAPLYEYDNVAVHSRYQAAGVRTEWTHTFSSSLAMKLEADYKRLYYQNGYQNYNGLSTALYATLYWSPDGRTTVFAGVDQLFKGALNNYDRYQQSGLRLGVSRSLLPGLDGAMFTTLRHRRFAAYASLYGDLRRDNEQFYSVQLKIPAWTMFTLTPSLIYRHRKNVSSLDWLSGYDKNEVLLRLERYF